MDLFALDDELEIQKYPPSIPSRMHHNKRDEISPPRQTLNIFY